MNRVRSACVKTNSSRTCFVSLSGDLAEAIGLRIQGQPFALQLQWTNGKAFTSWSGEVIRSKKHDPLNGAVSVIQLGKKFADSLGLVEDQQVLVEPVVSIPSCNRISVDPVSANDWEILELHAGYIESQLLNQVRVVFPNQLLPIWIQNNMCVVVQIVSLEPTASCVRLDEFTEVVVSPKTRTFSQPSKEKQASGNKLTPQEKSQDKEEHATTASCDNGDDSDDNPHLSAASFSGATNLEEQNSVGNSGLMSRFSDYLRTLFYAHGEDNSTHENPTSESSAEKESISERDSWTTFSSSSQSNGNCSEYFSSQTDFDLCLRVQPELRTNVTNESTLEHYSLQPTALFVDFESLPSLVLKSWTCNLVTFPPPDGNIVKTVQISRLLSPKEMTVSRASSTGASSRENQGSKSQESINRESDSADRASQDTTNQSSSDSAPAEMSMPRWIVRMVMTSGINNALIKQKSCEKGVSEHVLPGHVVLSKELSQLLGTKYLSLVKIQNISHEPSDIKGLILHPFGDTKQKLQDISADTVLEAFQGWICSICSAEAPLVLCSGVLLSFVFLQGVEPLQFVVTVLSHDQTSSSTGKVSYYHLTPETFDHVTVVIGSPHNPVNGPDLAWSTQESKPQQPKYSITDLGGVTDTFHKCLDHALSALRQRPFVNHLGGDIITGLRSGALLICGSGTGAGIGCGKTSLAHAVCCQLQRWPVCAHVTLVDCIPFRGKRVDTIQKQWQQTFAEAAWHQPSIILFDDLDQVVSAPSALQEMGGEALYKRRLAQVFKDLITAEIDNNSRVVVIATSKSRDSLHPSLLTSRGCHVFQCCVELHPSDNDQRKQILCAMLNKRLPVQDPLELELGSLAKKTEGFSPKDLKSLVDRAFHRAAIRKMNKLTEADIHSVITAEDFKVALEGFTPAALRGVSLHTAGELGWSDVGGLVAVKGALMETLLWPTKYSWLFSKCPLRMRSGLLLYGPPGTGKTLLAGVVAKECGLNFISIKGPELLSKYIGASEQAVRDMFTRAQSAKPCILFFDEFDSLAPRRGHDSTGVTDRVVNQLLTQLDGVEGLDGVYVLAATSRPDLIDPALLRPGRLDKCLYCGMPDKSERLQILQALSRSLTLAQNTNLAVISDMCEHFTGADFKALLYNAQLVAIHRNTSTNQLYKGVFSSAKTAKGDGISKDPLSAEVSDEETDNIIYIPSLAEGTSHVSAEELTKLQSEVLAAHDSRQHSNTNKKVSKVDSAKNQLAGGIQINQSDLLQAASSMGPSVSDSERRKYQEIYDTFIKSRGGDFSHKIPGQGKATLA